MKLICINEGWILREYHEGLRMPVFGSEYEVVREIVPPGKVDKYGLPVMGGTFYVLEGFDQQTAFHNSNFAILPDKSAEEMSQESKEAIVNIEHSIL